MTDKASHDDYLEKVKALQDMDRAEDGSLSQPHWIEAVADAIGNMDKPKEPKEHTMYDKLSAAELLEIAKRLPEGADWGCYYGMGQFLNLLDGKPLSIPEAAGQLENACKFFLNENQYFITFNTWAVGLCPMTFFYEIDKKSEDPKEKHHIRCQGPTPLHALIKAVEAVQFPESCTNATEIHAQPAKEVHGDDVPINEPPKAKAKVEASGRPIKVERKHTISIGDIRIDVYGSEQESSVTFRPRMNEIGLTVEEWHALVLKVHQALNEV